MDQDVLRMILEPGPRRIWLLYKALECVPLDRAIELARTADEFAMGGVNCPAAVAASNLAKEAAQPQEADAGEAEARCIDIERTPLTDNPEPLPSGSGSRLGLSPEQKQKLLERLAEGSTNAEIAAAFRLSPRQVQGIRMGSSRKKPAHRGQPGQDAAAGSVEEEGRPAELDEVIRYLRQQDDVVVSQADDCFLVNGRFRMAMPELVARANKMRSRQHKPRFVVQSALNSHKERPTTARVDGHPLFSNGSGETKLVGAFRLAEIAPLR